MNEQHDWTGVDRGWGHRVNDFATLSEPANCREYVALHHRLKVDAGDRLLDIACGAGLAIDLARARGASCAGIDASSRLIAVAAARNPDADVRVGDMHALPWADERFDVVTSFRGIWGTTPHALAEAHRVLAPGGRIGITVWGHIKRSPGAWALQPFSMAAAATVGNQASMVALGRPGAGEALLAEHGFEHVERITVPFVWEFSDPEMYARALASTGPAFEAIEHVGEAAFVDAAIALATERLEEGLPLRAEIDVVGYLAVKPARTSSSSRPHHLSDPVLTAEGQTLFDDDMEQDGFVMNASRLWAYQPTTMTGLFDLLGDTTSAGGLSMRQRGVLVTATASTLRDSYCSLAWGARLANVADDDTAAGVLRGDDSGLTDAERAIAVWARAVVRDPSATTDSDIDALRTVGFTDAQIFAITTYVALRIAFSSVNASLGARPDAAFRSHSPEAVRAAVTYGRPLADEPAI